LTCNIETYLEVLFIFLAFYIHFNMGAGASAPNVEEPTKKEPTQYTPPTGGEANSTGGELQSKIGGKKRKTKNTKKNKRKSRKLRKKSKKSN